MPSSTPDKQERQRQRKFARAKVRHFLFTHGPHRLTKGRTTQRHLKGEVQVRELTVESALWPAELDGLRIGHVSDFHFGDLMPAARAVAIIDLLAANAPDMIACTGDVIDLHCDGAEPIFDALTASGAPLGSFLVLGNHDELHDRRRVEAMARNSGVALLENERVEIVHNGAHLVVAGVTWGKSQRDCSRLVKRTCNGAEHILLSHNPKSFPRAAVLGIPLTLAGHTHGGQVAIRNQPALNLSLSHRRSAGLYEKRGVHLYVTTGVGAWFPLRVNCPAEVAVITMRGGPHVPSARDATPP